MKKIKFLTLIILGVMMAACSAETGVEVEPNKYPINADYSEEKMVSIDGSEFAPSDTKNLYVDKEAGFGLMLEEDIRAMQDEGGLNAIAAESLYMVLVYVPEASVKMYRESDYSLMTEEEQDQFALEFDNSLFDFAGVFCVKDENTEDETEAFEAFKGWFANMEELVKNGSNTYYFGYNTDYSGFDLTEDEIADVDKLISVTDTIKNSIFIFTPEEEEEAGAKILGDFTATTFDGEEITQAVFNDYDVTMITFWTSWCTYCAREMPHFEKVYQALPENANFLSICVDCGTEEEAGREVYEAGGGTFDVIIPDGGFLSYLQALIYSFPTTIFVDRDGDLNGLIQGVPSLEGSDEVYLEYITERLPGGDKFEE